VGNELDPLGLSDSDLEEAGGVVGTDQHLEVTEVEHSDGVSVGVQHVVVGDSMLAS
jgi:hypothetical protein